MSLSVDDLTSSLSASHIGQEANDLAALHAQLAQALFNQPIIHSSNAKQIPKNNNSQFTQPCNTPTFTSSFSFSNHVEGTHYQLASSWRSETGPHFRKDDDEDERMVEDLLIPSSPASPAIQQPALYSGQFDFIQSAADSSPSSSFVSTDPFYLAQCQALEKPTPSQSSFFTHLGLPTQQSPFVSHTSFRPHEHPETGPFTPHTDTRTYLLSSTPAFNR